MKCLNCGKEIRKGKYCMEKACRYKYLSSYIKERYRTDPEFREKVNTYNKNYRRKRYDTDPVYKEKSLKRLREYYFRKCLQLAKNGKIEELKKYMNLK